MVTHSSLPYGLLGPSGCGKSTILQCILGSKSLDSGMIEVSATSTKDIGYMPQDICLEEILTIKETFEYYGMLYNVSKENIKKKIIELNTFLKLPDLNHFIKNISGGQGKRVSLGVSLLHDPKIIILDEPTVGIDPVLRQEIWEKFKRMVEQQDKTIIITTHYIEEASQANRIGLMRNGVLVEEGSPQDILIKYNTESLESAFLTLCYSQDSNKVVHKPNNEINTIHANTTYTKSKIKTKTKTDETFSFRKVKALIKKNYHVFCRDYWLWFTIFILPIFQSFNLSFGVGTDFIGLELAIKSDEINLIDCKYSNDNGCIFDENNNQSQSCLVMNYLDTLGYKMIEVKDHEAGETIMNNTKSVAFIYFPKNYTKELIKFFDDSNNYDVQSQTYLHYTKSNVLFRDKVVKDVLDAMNYLFEKTLSSCSKNPKVYSPPLGFTTIVGKDVKLYLHNLTIVFLGMASFFFISIYSVTTMSSEKLDGFFSRSMIAGVTILELFISMFCIATVMTVTHLIFPMFIIFVIFSNPMALTSGLIMYAVLMIALGWLGFLFGLLIAGISPTKSGGTYMMNGWAMVQFLLSGGVWPIESQPPMLKTISELLPMRIACKTLSDIALKGWTWNNPSVLKNTAATFGHFVFLILLLFVLGKVKKDVWVVHK